MVGAPGARPSIIINRKECASDVEDLCLPDSPYVVGLAHLPGQVKIGKVAQSPVPDQVFPHQPVPLSVHVQFHCFAPPRATTEATILLAISTWTHVSKVTLEDM